MIRGKEFAVMERNRDLGRMTMPAVNGLPRRRQRITTLRDSTGEKNPWKKISRFDDISIIIAFDLVFVILLFIFFGYSQTRTDIWICRRP